MNKKGHFENILIVGYMLVRVDVNECSNMTSLIKSLM